jgi:hypothetical protein
LPKKTLPAELGVLCEALTRLINVDGAVVATLMSSRARELVYASDAIARQIDDLQFAVGEGPCLDAYTSQWPQLCPRIDAAGPRRRWLAFSAGVRELGVEAVFAFPVPGPQHSLGVLELYRRAAGPLNDTELNVASLYAEAIGYVIRSALPDADSPTDTATKAEAALVDPSNPFTRSEVYVASGVVALQLDVSVDEGLARVRAHAYAYDLAITAVAADIVAGRLSLSANGEP